MLARTSEHFPGGQQPPTSSGPGRLYLRARSGHGHSVSRVWMGWAAVALALAAAAWPGLASGGSSAGKGVTTYPLTITNCGQKVTFTKPPSRVLIMNGSSVAEVESMIVLGLQKSIVANAQSYDVSDIPGMVAAIKKIPTGGLTLNKNYDVPAEQTLAMRPDLVLSTWYGGFNAKSGFASRQELAQVGINSLVTPLQCALGNPSPTAAEQTAYDSASIDSTYQYLTLLGEIFNRQAKAAEVIASLKSRIAAVEKRVAGKPRPHILIAFPDMAMMNSNGVPAVFAGGIYDSVVNAAGGVNTFKGASVKAMQQLDKEALASADVDVLVVGSFKPNENLKAEADALFREFPEWHASKTRMWVGVHDGFYVGPAEAWAIAKIAKVAHP